MYCVYCGKTISNDARFCSGCGREVTAQETHLKSERYYCTQCNTFVPEGTQFCHKCGKVGVPAVFDSGVEQIKSPANFTSVQSAIPFAQSARHQCPWCSSRNIQYQVINESKPMGCFTFLFYLLLALTILGLLIVIPLMLRKKTETHTYAICQSCGRRWRIKSY